LLSVNNVSIGFPHRPLAVQEATLRIEPGEFVGILGTNGSGKSELVQGIAGLIPVRSGTITLDGKVLSGKSCPYITRNGVALVPEGRHVFTDLTVLENLEVTLPRRERELLDGIWERFPILHERADQLAGALSGGEQQQLAIGRALLMKPSLLLLDEPSAGLSPRLVNVVYDKLAEATRDMAVVVVEQVASLLLHRVDRLYVMRAGRIVKECLPAELEDPVTLRQLYFGAGEARRPANQRA
jgi:ABC-type branched-subunit amino acid transport system ATPase component